MLKLSAIVLQFLNNIQWQFPYTLLSQLIVIVVLLPSLIVMSLPGIYQFSQFLLTYSIYTILCYGFLLEFLQVLLFLLLKSLLDLLLQFLLSLDFLLINSICFYFLLFILIILSLFGFRGQVSKWLYLLEIDANLSDGLPIWLNNVKFQIVIF